MDIPIPKIVWTFWDTKKIPDTVQDCIKTWKFLNPDFQVIVINKNTLKQYTNVKVDKLQHSKDFPARFSDFVRVNILAEHGGVWLDASNICTQPLSAWLGKIYAKKPNTEFIGFYSNEFTTKKKYPVIENWAFACTANCQFMKLWRDEFMFSNTFKTMEDYVYNYLENQKHVDFQNISKFDDPWYLAMHCAAQKILQKDKYPKKNIVLFNAEIGPLKYRLYKKGRLCVKKRVERLCKDYKFWAVSPLIKFTGEDRQEMEKDKKLRKCIFNNVLLGIIKEWIDIE